MTFGTTSDAAVSTFSTGLRRSTRHAANPNPSLSLSQPAQTFGGAPAFDDESQNNVLARRCQPLCVCSEVPRITAALQKVGRVSRAVHLLPALHLGELAFGFSLAVKS